MIKTYDMIFFQGTRLMSKVGIAGRVVGIEHPGIRTGFHPLLIL